MFSTEQDLIMLVLLIFVIGSSRCDWVEISQSSNNNEAHPWDDFESTTFSSKNQDVVMPTLMSRRPDFTTTFSPLNVTKKRRNHAKIEKIQKNDDVTLNGFLPFLKTIQDPLIRSTKESLQSKMSLLTNLRDHLLSAVDERMSNLWMTFPVRNYKNRAEARGHYEEDQHEMDFPSNEGALMTIGFLTFAVFLIKLVLKLIHALKHKSHTHMTPTTAGATTYFGKRRKKRDDSVYEQFKILQLIDEYKFN